MMSRHFIWAFADLDALLVGARIERAFDLEPGFGRGRPDQLDHGKPIGERPPAPVLRDVAEQTVLPVILNPPEDKSGILKLSEKTDMPANQMS
jgi:hypothetical protein